MPEEVVKEDLCRLRERLERCAESSRRHRELLQTLQKEQEEMQDAVEHHRAENRLTASALESSRQQLQQLKRWMAQAQEEIFQKQEKGLRAVQELFKRHQWSELAKTIEEHTEAKKLLRDKIQDHLEREKCLREQPAWKKKARRDEAEGSLLQEMVAVRLEEQLASRRHSVTSWLRRFLLFLAFLEIILLAVVLLERDVLHWFLPPKMAVAFGSHPVRPHFF